MRQLWEAEGLSTVCDLAFQYTDGQDLQSHLRQKGVPREHWKPALAFWEEARRAASDATRAAGQGVAATLAANQLPRRPPGPSSVGRPPRHKRIRRLEHSHVSSSGRARSQPEAPAVASEAPPAASIGNPPPPPPVGLEVRERLYALYLALGPRGSRWLPFDAKDSALHRDLFLRQLVGVSAGCLGGAIRTWKRWLKWVTFLPTGAAVDTWAPQPIHLGAFLLDVSKGGPTAASGAWASLEWLRMHIGVPIPTDQPLVSSFRHASPGHTPTQAVELSPWGFLNLLELARSTQGSINMFVLQVLLLTMACIRWEHGLRSMLLRSSPSALIGFCSMGNARVGGRRQGFEWRAPRFLMESHDTLGPLTAFYQTLYTQLPSATFLIPDWELKRGRLTADAPWQPRPMQQPKFLELLRGVLLDAGYGETGAQRASYNTLRRFLPSLGEVLGFDDKEAQSISNWAEIAKGVRLHEARASHPMARHYAGDKHATACVNKHKAVIALHAASASLPDFPGRCAPWRPGAVTWDHVRAARPSIADAEGLAAGGPPWAAPGGSSARLDAAAPTSLPVQAVPATPEAAAPRPLPLEPPALFKLSMVGRAHMRRQILPDGRWIPCCREEPFSTAPVLQDCAYAVAAAAGGLCRGCFRRLHANVQDLMRQQLAALPGGVGQALGEHYATPSAG